MELNILKGPAFSNLRGQETSIRSTREAVLDISSAGVLNNLFISARLSAEAFVKNVRTLRGSS